MGPFLRPHPGPLPQERVTALAALSGSVPGLPLLVRFRRVTRMNYARALTVAGLLLLSAPLTNLGAAETPAAAAANPAPLVRAHSHNDYEHKRPLLDALDHGFCSVEADVFLVETNLLVAHVRLLASPERTLQKLYLDPLRERARQNGGRIFPGGPAGWLFIDLKTDADATYNRLHEILAGYPDLITRFEGERVITNAVTVVISGNRPRALMAAQKVRYATLDGRSPDLDALAATNLIHVVSDQWGKFFKWRGVGTMPETELAQLKAMVAKAHAKGYKLRLWAAPDTPAAWQTQYDAGVDLINTDNHAGMREFLLGKLAAPAGMRP